VIRATESIRPNIRVRRLELLTFKTGEKIVGGISTDKRMFTGISPPRSQLSAGTTRNAAKKKSSTLRPQSYGTCGRRVEEIVRDGLMGETVKP
jgi:hypothetical protein